MYQNTKYLSRDKLTVVHHRDPDDSCGPMTLIGIFDKPSLLSFIKKKYAEIRAKNPEEGLDETVPRADMEEILELEGYIISRQAVVNKILKTIPASSWKWTPNG